mgnify:CR=1 FL=1|tara:strand:- start:2480 stop:3712 length:1233 start_codon:yes stop_codon:yes gene_type:complete
MVIRRLAHSVRTFMTKEDGNFAMFAAVLIPLTFAVGSFAVDFASTISMKTRLQNAADGAALATASQLAQKTITKEQAEQYAIDFFNGMIDGDSRAYSGFSASPQAIITPIANGGSTIWKVEVKTSGRQLLTPMAHLVGQKDITVNVSGTSESSVEATTPLSMYLVLDHSGSMSWDSGQIGPVEVTKYCTEYQTRYWFGFPYRVEVKVPCGTTTEERSLDKMTVLKTAVRDLVDHIKEADPENKYSRMGAVAYNSDTTPYDKLLADWDKTRVSTFTNNLSATGGTNSQYAMKWASEQLKTGVEELIHKAYNGSNEPVKFIVFMTDGENDTGNDADDDYADMKTKKYCSDAKANKVTIFSVAFQAPKRGRDLLEACASGSSHYYDAKSADELIKAFKEIGEKATSLSTRLTS